MATKALISSGYRGRLGIIALVMLGCAGWFGYDGAVKYPAQAEMYSEFLRVREQHGEAGYWPHWIAYADERGWEHEQPEERSQLDIWVQYLCAGITLALGGVFGVGYIRSGGRWVASDEQGLHTSAGQHAPWGAIESVDKTRWASKGIAVVHYRDGGVSRRIKLDDWKYQQEPTNALMAEIEARLERDTPRDTPSADAASPGDSHAGSERSD